MGNRICYSTNGTPGEGNSLRDLSCVEWYRDSFIEPVPVFIYRVIRLTIWSVVQAITFLQALLGVIFVIFNSLYPVILFLLLFGFLAFFWWFLFPDLAPVIRDVGVPLLNLTLELLVIAWNIFMILWNLAVRVWNALTPLIGMLIYIVMDLFLTILDDIVHLLGEIDIWSLFKPLMEILELLTEILVEIIQAFVGVAVTLLQVMAKVIGAVIHAVFAVVEILFPIVRWILFALFKALEPVLEVVLAVVRWFTWFFAARSLLSLDEHSAGLLSGGTGGSLEDFHYDMYGKTYDSASRYWSRESYATAKRKELRYMNDFLVRHPARSFDYYWTVHRPYLSKIDYGGLSDVYRGVDESPGYEYEPSHGARHLLSVALERKLLSEEDLAELAKPSTSHDEYWRQFDEAESPEAHIEWFEEQHHASELKKAQIVRGIKRRLLESDGEAQNATRSFEPPAAKKRHAFDGELHKKIQCKGERCGGNGEALPHPVHGIRRMSSARKDKPHGSQWKDEGDTEEDHQRKRFIHVHVWSQAFLRGKDRFFRHMQNPVLHRHVRHAFNRTIGHDGSLQKFHEHVSRTYADGYHLIHENTLSLSDWGPLKYLKDADPEKHSRPYYSDWVKSVRFHEGKGSDGRKLLSVELDPQRDVSHRRLLEDIASDAEYTEWRAKTRETMPDIFESTDQIFRSVRQLLELPFDYPNPAPDAVERRQELVDRDARIQGDKPKPSAKLPLFKLLTQTNCYDSVPRNPLCMPEIPADWHIDEAPLLRWPENATGEDFCDYLYAHIDRDLTKVSTYISWDWIWNGIQSVRLFFSLFPLFTIAVGLLIDEFPFLSFVFTPFLALPPGKTPTVIDYICFFVFAPYALWLLYMIFWVFRTVIWPLLQCISQIISSYFVFKATFEAADEKRMERSRNTSGMLKSAAYDTDMNPGLRYYNDPNHFKRDWMGRARSYIDPNPAPHRPEFESNSRAYERAQTAGRYHRSSFMPMAGQTQYERFNAMSPYVRSEYGDSFENAYASQMPTSADPMSAPDVPSVEPSGAEIKASVARREQLTKRNLNDLEEVLLEGARVFGLPNSKWRGNGRDSTRSDLESFERHYGSLLSSYQHSLWWSIQYANYARKKQKIQVYYSPIDGASHRGYTRHTRGEVRSPQATPPSAGAHNV